MRAEVRGAGKEKEKDGLGCPKGSERAVRHFAGILQAFLRGGVGGNVAGCRETEGHDAQKPVRVGEQPVFRDGQGGERGAGGLRAVPVCGGGAGVAEGGESGKGRGRVASRVAGRAAGGERGSKRQAAGGGDLRRAADGRAHGIGGGRDAGGRHGAVRAGRGDDGQGGDGATAEGAGSGREA